MRRPGKNAALTAYVRHGSFTVGSLKKDTSLLILSPKNIEIP
jgi:hypothetical protein